MSDVPGDFHGAGKDSITLRCPLSMMSVHGCQLLLCVGSLSTLTHTRGKLNLFLLRMNKKKRKLTQIFGEQHLQHLQEYADQALTGLENEDTTWQAITYGIGLLDLGRRDFPFHPWNLQQLPQLVQRA